MSKKLLIAALLSSIILMLIILGIWFYQTLNVDLSRQVQKTAPTTKNYLLDFNQHIRFAERPVETFQFPIPLGQQGPVTSLYSGENQYPFYCMTLDSDLGQPLVDNQEGYGVPVYNSLTSKDKIIGYSKDCGALSRLTYYWVDENKEINKLSEEELNLLKQGHNTFGQLLRVEQGTINRFIYTIVMPINASEIVDRLAQSLWNKRLIYQFNGGSGIGYRQGRQTPKNVIRRQVNQLLDGYAIISSSGNKTSYTYNMLLAEDTARRVKHQFVSLYGEPLYTVGIGGSGGGLAQYIIAQNSLGILDGLLPQYSYPDMISQTTYALDCDLLNNYFTFRTERHKSWRDWNKRQHVEGMNAINDFPQRAPYLQPINQLMAGFIPSLPEGNNECINGYFGLSSLINNPKQGFIKEIFNPDIVKNTNWSYWQDLKNILGVDERQLGLTTWDNVGVQYGLLALQQGKISVNEFLDINKKIGSWKPQEQMEEETLLSWSGRKAFLWLSLWGNQNITKVQDGIAPRFSGSIAAMNAAYRSGQVFIGKVDLPILDVRHYLEDELDMHHISASFYSRARIQKANGNADNQVIWIANKNFNPVDQAFAAMDKWLLNIKQQPDLGVVANKPKDLNDACFNETGEIIAHGENSWDGQWNNKTDGPCQKVFPMYSNSRIQAGGHWAGDVFKCQLMPVEQAIKQGMYGENDMSAQQELLTRIFPQGVCDYEKPDMGRPENL